jgi:hypothetical protein
MKFTNCFKFSHTYKRGKLFANYSKTQLKFYETNKNENTSRFIQWKNCSFRRLLSYISWRIAYMRLFHSELKYLNDSNEELFGLC